MFHRLAAFSVRHRVPLLLAWGVALALAAPFSMRVEDALTGSFGRASDPGVVAVRRALAAFPGQGAETDVLVVRSTDAKLRAGSPAFDGAARAAVAALRRLPGVKTVTPYTQLGVPRSEMVGAGGHTALVLVGLAAGSLIQAEDETAPIRAALASVPRPAGVELLLTGAPAVYHDDIVAGKRDTTRAELVALPITGVALVLAFAALTAALIPLAIGLLSVTFTLAWLYLLGGPLHLPLNSFGQTVATMVGLAVGIDYALLVVARFREQLGRDGDPARAAIATGATAGRTVAVSGLAVAVSLGALAIPDSLILRSMGLAGVVAVAVALAAALTMVPALLSLLGRRVDAPAWLHHALARPSASRSAWGRWARAVLRRPLRYALLALALLGVLALPARRLVPGLPGAEDLPKATESRRGAEALSAMGGAGLLDPMVVLVDAGGQGQAFTPAFVSASLAFTRRLEAQPGIAAVIGPTSGPSSFGAAAYGLVYRSETIARHGPLAALVNATVARGGDRVLFTVLPSGALTRASALALETRVRRVLRGFPALHPAQAAFGGWALESADIVASTWSFFPPMAAGVLLVTLALLVLAFRSLVVPLKAVILNSLSVLVGYGVLVGVFQLGWGAGLLGLTAPQPPRIDFVLPILLFAVVFGLSMDYEVFLVSRIRELHRAGASTERSIVVALERTGPVITWAAVIMSTVFLAFLSASTPYIVQTGLPLAVAILVDATLVRVVLVPAFMRLAGRWNWWLPGWLDRALPHLDLPTESADGPAVR